MSRFVSALCLLTLAISLRSVVAQKPRPAAASGPERTRDLVGQLADASKAPDAGAELLRIGKPAVPVLLAVVLREGGVATSAQSRRALAVLGRLGPDAIAAFDRLVEALLGADDAVFVDVMRTIADLVPWSGYQGNPRALEALVFRSRGRLEKLVKGNDRQRFQYELNRMMQRSQVDPDAGLRAMVAELTRNRTHRREVAAEVVARMGPKASSALAALDTAFRKGAPVVGQIGGFRVPKYRDEFPHRATEAMVRIAPNDPRTVVAWAWMLEHSDRSEVRRQAALRIGAQGEKAAAYVDDLVRALRDKGAGVRAEVVTALGLIGPGAKRAIPALRKLTAGSDRPLAVRAKVALRSIEGEVGKEG